eukprot:4946887-Amphidinium_carterae.1
MVTSTGFESTEGLNRNSMCNMSFSRLPLIFYSSFGGREGLSCARACVHASVNRKRQRRYLKAKGAKHQDSAGAGGSFVTIMGILNIQCLNSHDIVLVSLVHGLAAAV